MRTAAKPTATPLPNQLRPSQSVVVAPIKPASNLWRDAARRFSKNKLAVGALLVMLLLILVAIFADLIAPQPYDYSVLAEANQFPNARHLLGTDAVGRDFLSRLIYGARVSLIVGFSVQAIALGDDVSRPHDACLARRSAAGTSRASPASRPVF